MANESKSDWTQVGTIRKSKKGSLYMKLDNKIENLSKLKNAIESEIQSIVNGEESKGISLQIQKPSDKLDRLLDLGYIDQTEYDRRLGSIPEYIRQEVTLPPPK